MRKYSEWRVEFLENALGARINFATVIQGMVLVLAGRLLSINRDKGFVRVDCDRFGGVVAFDIAALRCLKLLDEAASEVAAQPGAKKVLVQRHLDDAVHPSLDPK